MMVARRTRGVRVRKPPKEESAGGVTKLERQKLWGSGRWRLVAGVR